MNMYDKLDEFAKEIAASIIESGARDDAIAVFTALKEYMEAGANDISDEQTTGTNK